MKDQLVFDTTDAGTIADSDSVGAYLRASDGTLLTHTDVGGKKALDVRVAEGINVEVDLSYTDDSVTAHQGGTWTVTANDAALANTAIASGATTLASANVAQNVVASPLSARKYLLMYNNDNQKLYVGQSGVSAANGFPLSPGSYMELRCGASIDIEFVSAKASHDLRYLELS